MADTPEDKIAENPELPPMGWLEGNSTRLPQPPRPFLLNVSAATYGMTFGQAVLTIQEGYVPDPHDDPKKLLELIMDSASLPKECAPWPSDLPQQIDLIYKLAGELGSKMSEIELGWYLALISLMPKRQGRLSTQL